MRVLNLYAGLGGNRKLWPDGIEVTAVERDPLVAEEYRKCFPNNIVIVGDAHQYLLDHFAEFDFIWSSPPCPTHSGIRRMAVDIGRVKPVFPDMRLYEEIIFLQHFFNGKYCVENVIGYYDPLILPVVRHRHYLWTNFFVSEFVDVSDKLPHQAISGTSVVYGFDLRGVRMTQRKDKLLRNCVDPKLGLHVFNCAFANKQQLLAVFV